MEGLFSMLFGAIILVLDLVAIASVLMGTSSIERKLLWTVVILLLPIIGLIAYYLFGRRAQDADLLKRHA